MGRIEEGTSKNKLDLWLSLHKRKLKRFDVRQKVQRLLRYWQEMKILCANKCSCSCGTRLAGFSFGDSEVWAPLCLGKQVNREAKKPQPQRSTSARPAPVAQTCCRCVEMFSPLIFQNFLTFLSLNTSLTKCF